MQDLGSHKGSTAAFTQTFVQSTENIVFDETHLVFQLNKMQINQKGHNSTGSYDPQVSLLYMFATKQKLPVYYRIFPGNICGTSALKFAIKESGVKNACVIGDKGFSYETNVNMLDETKIDYVFPLKCNHRWVNYERLQTRGYDQSFNGHFFIVATLLKNLMMEKEGI